MKDRVENETQPADTPIELNADLLKIESLIATAVRLVDEGRVVNLAALQGRTKHVCDAAVQLSVEDAKPLIPAMESVLTQLDKLTENLNKRYGDLPMLSSRVGSDAAASVYGRTLKHFP
jgi:S-adenosylhomocysteine hydrolase